MKGNEQIEQAQRKSLTATCINLMARFSQVARREEDIDLHLQDKNILHKISAIAAHTDNPRLQLLHTRLLEELDKAPQADAAVDLGETKKTPLSNKFREWTKNLR